MRSFAIQRLPLKAGAEKSRLRRKRENIFEKTPPPADLPMFAYVHLRSIHTARSKPGKPPQAH